MRSETFSLLSSQTDTCAVLIHIYSVSITLETEYYNITKRNIIWRQFSLTGDISANLLYRCYNIMWLNSNAPEGESINSINIPGSNKILMLFYFVFIPLPICPLVCLFISCVSLSTLVHTYIIYNTATVHIISRSLRLGCILKYKIIKPFIYTLTDVKVLSIPHVLLLFSILSSDYRNVRGYVNSILLYTFLCHLSGPLDLYINSTLL